MKMKFCMQFKVLISNLIGFEKYIRTDLYTLEKQNNNNEKVKVFIFSNPTIFIMGIGKQIKYLDTVIMYSKTVSPIKVTSLKAKSKGMEYTNIQMVESLKARGKTTISEA